MWCHASVVQGLLWSDVRERAEKVLPGVQNIAVGAMRPRFRRWEVRASSQTPFSDLHPVGQQA